MKLKTDRVRPLANKKITSARGQKGDNIRAIPHRRYNPLSGKWLLVSPQRMLRPWRGQSENPEEPRLPAYDATCYLCPGNARQNGEKNPDYQGVHSFVNDFSAMVPPSSSMDVWDTGIGFFLAPPEAGICEVLCYVPAHDRSMATMGIEELKQVIHAWRDRSDDLGRLPYISHVQIFENRGNEAGNSNLHPHGQIWAQGHVPAEVETEMRLQKEYFEKHGTSLLQDYLHEELRQKTRVLYRNDSFAVLVPFWAAWPYETMIGPLMSLQDFGALSEEYIGHLAEALSAITRAYASFFGRSRYGAPYTMGVHQRPFDNKEYPGMQLHIHFHPPLLTTHRQKFMVGYERFGETQRDITAEYAANELRQHFDKIKTVGG